MVKLASEEAKTERVRQEQLTKRQELETSARTSVQTKAMQWVALLSIFILTLVFFADKLAFAGFAEKLLIGTLGFFGGLGFTRVKASDKKEE